MITFREDQSVLVTAERGAPKISLGDAAASWPVPALVSFQDTLDAKTSVVAALAYPALPPLPWYYSYLLGGSLPFWFGDFSTEGGNNQYYYNGATYASFAALRAALSGSVSRASSAYYRNAAGLQVSVGNNVPRFDYDAGGNPLGLLVEPAATNLLTYSKDFTNGAWISFIAAGGSTPVVTASFAAGPDGIAASAQRVQFARTSATGSYSLLGNVPSVSAAMYRESIWLKSNTGLNQNVYMYTNGISQTVVVTPSWQRFSVYSTVPNTNPYIVFGTEQGAGGDLTLDLLAWNAQSELDLGTATSDIITTSAPVTRAADNILAGTFGSSLGSALTFFAEAISAVVPASNTIPAALYDPGSSDYFSAPAYFGASGIRDVDNAAAANVGDITGPSIVAASDYRIAARAQNASYALAVNGTLYTTNTGSGGTPSINPKKLYLGSLDGSSAPFFGWIKRAGIWQIAAGNVDLQVIAT